MYNSLQNLDLTDQQRETLNYLIRQAERYEKLRKVTAMEFCDLFMKNLSTGTDFDAMVDDLKEF